MIKKYLEKIDLDKLRPLGIAAICFAAVFIAGFSAGQIYGGSSNSTEPGKRSLTNSNINTEVAAKPQQTAKTAEPAMPANSTNVGSECYIKGSKSKIYHIPGGSFYDRTNPVQCFNSEEEALAAGYTKSSR